MQNHFGLLVADFLPIYMIIPRYSHNYAQFCQLLNSNLFNHHKIPMLLREATSETYGPRAYFWTYKFSIYFILQSLLSNLYHKNTKNIYLIIIISIRSRKWLWRDWQPLYCVGCEFSVCLCRCMGLFEEPPTGLIPWFSKTEGSTYATLLHHPFLFKGKPTQCSRGSKKDF